MSLTSQPRLFALALSGGTLVLFGGVAVAVTLPAARTTDVTSAQAASPTQSKSLPPDGPALIKMGFGEPLSWWGSSAAPAKPSAAPPSSATAAPPAATAPTTPASTPPAAAASTPAPAAAPVSKSASITYVVKPGDTLLAIALWFKKHGFEGVYNRNRAVIGADVNLIRPGERITLTPGVDGVMTFQH